MDLIFIGDHFYSQSGSFMSSLYDTNGYRQDWGKVNCALRAGKEVRIRPATASELKVYEAQLTRLKREQKAKAV